MNEDITIRYIIDILRYEPQETHSELITQLLIEHGYRVSLQESPQQLKLF
jgi:hypothetical protein